MNRRPTGVVLAATLLALGALLDLLMAGLMAASAALTPRTPLPATPGYASPPAALIMGIVAFTALFFLALAVWGGITVAGLLRMRPWGRISILIIAGCLTAISLFNVLIAAAVPTLLRSMPMPPNADPSALRIVFLFGAAIWLIAAAIGIWWLVYFTLRSTRQAFLNQPPPPPQRPVDPRARTAPPSTLADFTLAEPLAEPLAVTDLPALDVANAEPLPDTPGWNAAITSTVPAPRPPKGRPVSTTIIGAFLIVGAFFALLESVIPMPLFLFGVILRGWPAHLTVLAWAVFLGYAGFGLIQLKLPAWWLTVAFTAVSLANSLAMLFPAYRARMAAYTAQISNSMSAGFPNPTLPPEFLSFLYIASAIFGILFTLFILVLLHRARWAFQPTPPTP